MRDYSKSKYFKYRKKFSANAKYKHATDLKHKTY